MKDLQHWKQQNQKDLKRSLISVVFRSKKKKAYTFSIPNVMGNDWVVANTKLETLKNI